MDSKSSIDEHSDDEYLAFEIERNPAGIRVETSNDRVWTFRRDLDAYNDGEDAWIPDFDDTPSEIVTALEHQGYEIRE